MSSPAIVYLRHLADKSILATRSPHVWLGGNDVSTWERLPATTGRKAYQQQCCRELRKLLKPGRTVYTNQQHVSRSGMMRTLTVQILAQGRIRDITGLVADACGFSQNDRGAIKVSGCGFDAGFQIVYDLGHALWPKGTRKPHGTRNGVPDHDGGYALKHERA